MDTRSDSLAIRWGIPRPLVYNTHLLIDIDPRVVRSVLEELQDLTQLANNDISTGTQIASANGAVAALTNAVPAIPSIDSGQWLPSIFPIKQDVTCTRCWGFQDAWSARVAPTDLSS